MNHPIERQKALETIGMVWDKPDAWETRFELAKHYFSTHGDLQVPARYKPDGVWLNKWLNEQRQIYQGNRAGKTLTEEQVNRLTSIGMVWEKQRKSA